MSNKIVLRQTASITRRRQPLLEIQSSKKGCAVGEVVGGTAAECVAVCCCCPCGLAHFLLLAVYKIPAGLCRKMLRKRRRRRVIKDGLLQPKRRNCYCGCCDINYVNGVIRVSPMCVNDGSSDIKRLEYSSEDDDAIALEKEMWERFYSAGFWRSFSRRESSQSQSQSQSQSESQSPQIHELIQSSSH